MMFLLLMSIPNSVGHDRFSMRARMLLSNASGEERSNGHVRTMLPSVSSSLPFRICSRSRDLPEVSDEDLVQRDLIFEARRSFAFLRLDLLVSAVELELIP